VDIAATTDFLTQRARATLALATVLIEQGDHERAAEQARRARRLFEVKGDEPGSAMARALIRTC
jgi:HEPN domain-containing protein